METFLFIARAFGALTAFVVFQKLASRIPKDNRLLKYFGSRSMTIYLFHQQLIYFALTVLHDRVPFYICAGICFIFSIAGSLLISELLRFKSFRFLLGEK